MSSELLGTRIVSELEGKDRRGSHNGKQHRRVESAYTQGLV